MVGLGEHMVGLGEHTWYWESTHGRIRRAHMVLGEHTW